MLSFFFFFTSYRWTRRPSTQLMNRWWSLVRPWIHAKIRIIRIWSFTPGMIIVRKWNLLSKHVYNDIHGMHCTSRGTHVLVPTVSPVALRGLEEQKAGRFFFLFRGYILFVFILFSSVSIASMSMLCEAWPMISWARAMRPWHNVWLVIAYHI